MVSFFNIHLTGERITKEGFAQSEAFLYLNTNIRQRSKYVTGHKQMVGLEIYEMTIPTTFS